MNGNRNRIRLRRRRRIAEFVRELAGLVLVIGIIWLAIWLLQ